MAVVEVGGGGRAGKSGSMPGIASITTFSGAFWTSIDMWGQATEQRYLDLDPVWRWRVCDAAEDEIKHVLGM